MLEIIYQDKDLLAINKPAGLLVHKSNIARNTDEDAVSLLEDQIGQPVFPAHRIDRPTSGILLFALNAETANALSQQLQEKSVDKRYLALLRGFCPQEGLITKPLTSEYSSKEKSAASYYKKIAEFELPIPLQKFQTTRYSLVQAMPITGRTHQLRLHFAHIRHYIIDDKKHGDVKQNKHLKTHFALENMFLHAYQLTFTHPVTQQQIILNAKLPDHWHNFEKKADLNLSALLTTEELSHQPKVTTTFITDLLSREQERTHHIYG